MGDGEDRIWRVFDLPDGRLLVQWYFSRRGGQGRDNLPYLSVHDASGSAVTRATLFPWKNSVPVSVDESGLCSFFHRASNSTEELVTARLR